MEEFNTYEKAEDLFRRVDGLGENNCIFLSYTDTAKYMKSNGFLVTIGVVGCVIGGIMAGAIGGAIAGGIVGAIACFTGGASSANKKSDGYLINWSEKGLGFIPLKATGAMLLLSPEKLKADTASYFFLGYDQLESISIKNFNIFNSSVKNVKIAVKNNQNMYMLARVDEKEIPYQKYSSNRFFERFK